MVEVAALHREQSEVSFHHMELLQAQAEKPLWCAILDWMGFPPRITAAAASLMMSLVLQNGGCSREDCAEQFVAGPRRWSGCATTRQTR